jgi:hypothetical protein
MTHAHAHTHDRSSYYLEQLCTIGACGALGLVALLLNFQKTLDNQKVLSLLLTSYLHPYLVGSGVVLLAGVGLRGTFLWLSVRRRRASHDHLSEHEESYCDQHDHDHEHGWRPLRYIVLSLPVMLFFLGLPNEGFRSVKALEIERLDRDITEKKGDVIHLDFVEFYDSVYNEAKREFLQGRTGVLKGQFVSGNSATFFNVVRFVRPCCPADAIPLRVPVVSPESIADIKNMSWVEVIGQIQYRKGKDRDQYFPVLKLRSRHDIVPTTPEDPYFLESKL